MRRSIAFCRKMQSILSWSARKAPLCAGIVDDLEAAGIKAFGPSRRRGTARRLQGLHQGPVPGELHTDRGL